MFYGANITGVSSGKLEYCGFEAQIDNMNDDDFVESKIRPME